MTYFHAVISILITIISSPIISFVSAQPIAIHQLIIVNSSDSTLVRFRGYDDSNPKLKYVIKTIPTSGKIYQLSQVFSDYSYNPIQGALINQTNAEVTGSQNRVYYRRPSLDRETNGLWDTVKFIAKNSSSESYEGYITFVPPTGMLIGSDFLLSNEAWTVVGNKEVSTPASFEQYSRGLSFKNYVFGTEDKINLKNGIDSSLWYFQAPSKFLMNLGIAYGGKMSFSLLPFSGDMTKKYSGDIPVVELQCMSCPGPLTMGIRLVFPISAISPSVFTSSPWNFELSLLETAGWLKDSQNTLAPWLPVTQCDLIQVLSRLSSFRILGDWTPWYETIALDNVQIRNTKAQLPLCAMKRTDASICDC